MTFTMDQKQVCTSVMRSLNNLRLSETFCDVTLLVGEVPIRAHKAVLAGTSKFFHAILSADGGTDMFQINGIDATSMVTILDFLYTGQVLLNSNNVSAISAMAEQLKIGILRDVCNEFSNVQRRKREAVVKRKHHENDVIKGASRTRTYKRWGQRRPLHPVEVQDGDSSDQNNTSPIRVPDPGSSECDSQLVDAGTTVASNLPSEQYIYTMPEKTMETTKAAAARPTQQNVCLATSPSGSCYTLSNSSPGETVSKVILKAGCIAESGCLAKEEEPADEADSPPDSQDIPVVASSVEGIVSLVCPLPTADHKATVNVHSEQELQVTPTKDIPGQVFITDATVMDGDLTPLIDIQNLLSTYSSGPQLGSHSAESDIGSNAEREASETVPADSQLSSFQDIKGQSESVVSVARHSARETTKGLIQVIDNLPPLDVTGFSAVADEAGFHDYCIIPDDAIRFLPDSERAASQLDPGVEKEIICQNSENSATVRKVDSLEEVNGKSNKRDVLVEHVSSPVDACLMPLLPTSQATTLTSERTRWSDTHIMIIQQPPEDQPQVIKAPANDGKPVTPSPTKLKGIRCRWCSSSLPSHAQLRAHARDAHPEHLYSCGFCDRLFVEEDQCDNHTDWCRVGDPVDGRFRCPECSYSAAKAFFVVNHYRAKHTTRQQRTCISCGQTFHILANYYDHRLQEHDVATNEVPRRKVHTCADCGFRTVKAYVFKTHRANHSGERHVCGHCGKLFKTALILQRHEKLIHNELLITCRQCDFSSRYAATVKAHEYRLHNLASAQQTVYHCHYCDYSNVDQANLRKHERFKHSDYRPHLCAFCPKAFKHKSQLTIHERAHTGTRPFQCTLCSYAGRSKVALVTHHKHRHSDAKPFVCELCGFRTKGSSNLWFHKVRCRKRNAAPVSTEGTQASVQALCAAAQHA